MRRNHSRPASWQLRLPGKEDVRVGELARERAISKNDVVRYALRLLLRLENETEAGARLLVERSDGGREPVEVWLLW